MLSFFLNIKQKVLPIPANLQSHKRQKIMAPYRPPTHSKSPANLQSHKRQKIMAPYRPPTHSKSPAAIFGPSSRLKLKKKMRSRDNNTSRARPQIQLWGRRRRKSSTLRSRDNNTSRARPQIQLCGQRRRRRRRRKSSTLRSRDNNTSWARPQTPSRMGRSTRLHLISSGWTQTWSWSRRSIESNLKDHNNFCMGCFLTTLW